MPSCPVECALEHVRKLLSWHLAVACIHYSHIVEHKEHCKHPASISYQSVYVCIIQNLVEMSLERNYTEHECTHWRRINHQSKFDDLSLRLLTLKESNYSHYSVIADRFATANISN